MSISAQAVKELRERTGLGMMDCKTALSETNGDMEKAVEWLRKKGMAKSAKVASRIAAEGVVTSYIHSNRIGVLLELNCETDFTARNDNFNDLARDICMHIAAANPRFVSEETADQSVVAKEREIAIDQAKGTGKPEAMIEKIAEGKVRKFLEENCLLNQKFIKNTEKSVQEILSEKIATIGEKITVRRFVRWEVGEGLEKRQDNFAEEVAKQMGSN